MSPLISPVRTARSPAESPTILPTWTITLLSDVICAAIFLSAWVMSAASEQAVAGGVLSLLERFLSAAIFNAAKPNHPPDLPSRLSPPGPAPVLMEFGTGETGGLLQSSVTGRWVGLTFWVGSPDGCALGVVPGL